jgi:hypothetical protein
LINFFRKIRKSFLADNKLAKYFLYTTGEIILVVFGILIALQVNNWNEDRVNRKKEATYLNNIKRDLNNQLKSLDLQLQFEESIIKTTGPILEQYKKNNSILVDSLFTASIGKLTGRMTFVKIDPTYTELLSAGNIDIIRNEEIKSYLINYYQNMERMERVINNNNNLYTDAVFVPNMLELSEFQLGSQYHMKDNQLSKKSERSQFPFDLNTSELKEITVQQLKIPANKMRFMNMINYRNMLAIFHKDMVEGQKERTYELLRKLDK